MSIKYDGKIGKLFQANMAVPTLEKDKIEISQLCEKLGGEVIKLDSITTDSINIFDSVYEISGDGRYSFVEGLKKITDVKIVDERDESIRVSVRTHWNPTTSEEEELVKQRFSKLLNSMEQSLAIHRIN